MMAVFSVSNVSDDINSSDPIGLREAIVAANTTSGTDVIEFDPALLAHGHTDITLTNGQLPTITQNLSIIGPGQQELTIDAQDLSRIFQIASGATVTLSGLTLRGGGGVDTGAGISNAGNLTLDAVHLTDSHTRGNSGNWNDYGGAINSVNGSLHIKNSTIDANSARFVGGVRFVANSTDDTLEIVNSLIDNNSTLYVDGFFGHIGGLSVSVDGSSSGPLSIVNSTISRNHANLIAGIHVGTNAHLEITNSTITGNVASGSQGGISAYDSGSLVTLKNSIVAGNTDPLYGGFHSDVYQYLGEFDIENSTNNIIGIVGWSGLEDSDNVLYGDELSPQYAGLAPLGNYGGPTKTYALLPDSPAIDFGDDNLAVGLNGKVLTTDQRGGKFRRINGASVDVGAIEANLVQDEEGNLTIYGSDANDQIYANDSFVYFQLGTSSPFVLLTLGTWELPYEVTSISAFGFGGMDVISFASVSLPTEIHGGAGADWLTGGAGIDHLYGGDGVDELNGNAGDDILDGGAGPDDLFPGSGTDTPAELIITSPVGVVASDNEAIWTVDWTGVDPLVDHATIDWGDENTSNVPYGETSAAHTYATYGTYSIAASYDIDGDTVHTATLSAVVLSAELIPPVNPTAVALGASSEAYPRVTVSWTDMNVDPDKVKIYRSDDGLSGWTDTWPPEGVAAPGNSYPYYVDQEKRYFRLTTVKDGIESAPTLPFTANHPANQVVELSASVDTSGAHPTVTLSWPNEYYLTGDYADDVTFSIYRKSFTDSNWGTPIDVVTADDIGNAYTDDDVSLDVNHIYEYRVQRTGGPLGAASGFVAAAVELSETVQENRGSVVLVVDNRFVDSLEFEIARLREDLVGDGWHVIQHNVDVASQSVEDIRGLIVDDYEENVANSELAVHSVLLLGHIPVPMSGWHTPDGHDPRALPADAFYGDMDGVWHDDLNRILLANHTTGDGDLDEPHSTLVRNVEDDGQYDENFVPYDGDDTPQELSVGRVDMFGMAAFDPKSQYTGGGDWQKYTIPVGQAYTGTFDYLSFVSGDHMASDRYGTSEFRNLVIHNGTDPDIEIDFDDLTSTLESAEDMRGDYRYGWDSRGTTSSWIVNPDGSLTLSGNVWKVASGDAPFVITPDTVIEVEMRSSSLPQVVAIGFDTENNSIGYEDIYEDYTFRLHADDNAGWGRAADVNSEAELLRQYLNKDHAYRNGQLDVPNRAFIDDTLVATTPLRNFTPLFGAENIDMPVSNATDWYLQLQTEAYTWAYGGGRGGFWSSGGVLDSAFLVDHPSNAVFNEQFGSWSVDWSRSDGLLRSILANQGLGLTATWGNWGDFAYYHMGSGSTIGDANLISQNRGDQFGTNGAAETFTALMGDPTLRMHIVAPPTNLTRDIVDEDDLLLDWSASADSADDGFIGYYVYAADDANDFATYERITPEPITDTFLLRSIYDGDDIYMVRAVKLEQTASGSYFNLSQGEFTDRMHLVAAVNAGGIALTSLGTTFSGDTSGTPSSYSNASAASSATSSTGASIVTATAALGVPIGTNSDIFKTARVDTSSGAPMEWNFDGVISGRRYAVRLYFAEIETAAQAVGERVFEVTIEGQTVLDNFDIYREAGAISGNLDGMVKTFVVEAQGGTLDIDFAKVMGSTYEPLVCGIEVYSLG